MEHVLKTLKYEHPELTRVVYRQDNAGCYHCATIIIACKLLRERTKVDLCRIDFRDPQGGKGPCDRKAAQIKMHVKQYINQGHSVTTPADLRKAIESNESSTGGPLDNEPIRLQKNLFQPIRELHMAHVTSWPRGRFSETGTECNALRAGFGGVGRARSCMGSRLGPEMTSWQPG